MIDMRCLKSARAPMGLLPKGVKEFKIDETGLFEVHLGQACNAKFESELHYDVNVTGSLSYWQIGVYRVFRRRSCFCGFLLRGFELMCRVPVLFISMLVLFLNNFRFPCLRCPGIVLLFVMGNSSSSASKIYCPCSQESIREVKLSTLSGKFREGFLVEFAR